MDAFVAHFNEHFTEFGAEKPEVGQLTQLARLLGITRWLRDNDVPIDDIWLGAYAIDGVETPITTPGQVVEKSQTEVQGNYILTHTVTLFGGVDFYFTNNTRVPPAGDPVHSLGEIPGNLSSDQMNGASPVLVGGQEYRVAAAPITERANWGTISSQVIQSASGRRIVVERDRRGRIIRVLVPEGVITADVQIAREALDTTILEEGSLLQTLLDNPDLNLSWLLDERFKQVVVKPAGKRTIRVEEEVLVVDGRIGLEQLRDGWEAGRVWLEQLGEQGYTNLILDPESGAAAGSNPANGELGVIDGEGIAHSFTQDQIRPEDLPRLVTDLGAQSRGLWVAGLFQTPEGGWSLLTPAGELEPVLSGAETALRELDEAARAPGNREQARQLAAQLGALLRQDILGAFETEWQVVSAASVEELVLEVYPAAQYLFPDGLPADLVIQLEGDFRPGDQLVRLKPIETSFGWLLPGSGPFFLDIPSTLGFLVSYHLGANNLRLIAPHSTPLRAQAYLDQERPVIGEGIAVLFTPHSQSSPGQAETQRQAFQPVKEQLEALGVRVEDIGEDPAGRERLLEELANEDLVIFEVAHSGLDGRMYVYGDGNLHPLEFQVARGVKHFMTCCSVQTGVAAAAVRAGADSATGAVEPITLDEVNALLGRLADFLAQHPAGASPSIMEFILRLQTLIEYGGPGRGPSLLPVSRAPDAGLAVCS